MMLKRMLRTSFCEKHNTLNDTALSQRPTWQWNRPLINFQVEPLWHAT